MREIEIQTDGAIESTVRSKLQCISAAALNALERQLREQRLPVEEQAFLCARLESYRKAAALASHAGCSRPDCCVA